MSASVAPIARNALLKALQRTFGFTDDDLRMNQEGRLANGQRIRLLDRVAPTVGATVLALFIWLILWLIYASVIRKLPVSDALSEVFIRIVQPQLIWQAHEVYGQFNKAPLVYSGAAVSAVLLAIAGICALPFRMLRDLYAGVVYMEYGRVETEQGEKKKRGQPDGIVRYYYRLRDSEPFEVTRQAFDAIDSGGLYAVYYVPRSRIIVAVEPRMDAARLPTPLSEGPLPSLRMHPE
jgi:hypothetical protein